MEGLSEKHLHEESAVSHRTPKKKCLEDEDPQRSMFLDAEKCKSKARFVIRKYLRC